MRNSTDKPRSLKALLACGLVRNMICDLRTFALANEKRMALKLGERNVPVARLIWDVA